MAYCGCGTGTAKLRWAAATVFFIVGVLLFGLFINETRTCSVCWRPESEQFNGHELGLESFECSRYPKISWDEGDYAADGKHIVNDCDMSTYRAGIIGGPLFMVLGIVSCLIMICARRPEAKDHADVENLPHAGVAPAGVKYAV